MDYWFISDLSAFSVQDAVVSHHTRNVCNIKHLSQPSPVFFLPFSSSSRFKTKVTRRRKLALNRIRSFFSRSLCKEFLAKPFDFLESSLTPAGSLCHMKDSRCCKGKKRRGLRRREKKWIWKTRISKLFCWLATEERWVISEVIYISYWSYQHYPIASSK